MKKKLDFSKAKDFLFRHGEKVALGVCATVALSIGLLGLLHAFSAAKSKQGLAWADEFKKSRDSVQQGINGAQPKPPDSLTLQKLNGETYEWTFRDSHFIPTLYNWVGEKPQDKRDNPRAYNVKCGPDNIAKRGEHVQFDYISAPIFTYEYDVAGRQVKVLGDPKKKDAFKGSMPVYLRAATPTRMLVISMVFPMKAQFEEFQRKLRFKTQADLLNAKDKDDLPHFAGMNVIRYEHNPDGSKKQTTLILHDSRNGTKLAEPLKRLLRDAVYDEPFAERLEAYIWDGVTMPMPKNAVRSYPRIELDGIVDNREENLPKSKASTKPVEKEKKKEFPKFPFFPGKKDPTPQPAPQSEGSTEPVANLSAKDLKALDPALFYRLFDGNFHPMHVLGYYPLPSKGADTLRFSAAWKVQGPVKMVDDDEKKPAPATAAWDRDALVRFIDPDVEPGKTYSYAIQVRLKNPNYKKNEEVAYQGLAAVEELPPDGLVTTDPVTIQHEYYVYAVDQQLLDDWASGTDKKQHEVRKDQATFQVHQWVKKSFNLLSQQQDEYVIGDWIVAERINVRKGEYIGMDATVVAPCWKKDKDTFVLPHDIRETKGGPPKEGMKINLLPEGDSARVMPPVLVDFSGGKRLRGNMVEEEAAVDALIMTSDGRMYVLNSREQSDEKQANEELSSAARNRAERVNAARERVTQIKEGHGTPPRTQSIHPLVKGSAPTFGGGIP